MFVLLSIWMKSFLGFTNFYCYFIDNYFNIITPLTQLHLQRILHGTSATSVAPPFTNSRMPLPLLWSSPTGCWMLHCWHLLHPLSRWDSPHHLLLLALVHSRAQLQHSWQEVARHSWPSGLGNTISPVNLVIDLMIRTLSTLWQWNSWLTSKPGGWSSFSNFIESDCLLSLWLAWHKADALTRCWDVYSKEGNKNYTFVSTLTICSQYLYRNSLLYLCGQYISHLQCSRLVPSSTWRTSIMIFSPLFPLTLWLPSTWPNLRPPTPVGPLTLTVSSDPMNILDFNNLWYKHDQPLSKHVVWNQMLKWTMSYSAQFAPTQRLQGISPMGWWNNSPSWRHPGTPSPWTLQSSSLHSLDIPQS